MLPSLNSLLGWIYWDPNPIAFYIPYLNWPIYIYALCFVFGLICGYLILIPILQKTIVQSSDVSEKEAHKKAYSLADKMIWYIIIGMVVGARLGHVFLYDWDLYKYHLWSILNIREGGLASHGGTIGILFALFFFYRSLQKEYPKITFPALVDMVAIPTGFAIMWIRIGNFFNQEIIGSPSSMPWAILFGHPREGGKMEPRHPVQLYEALAYLLIFCFLYMLWRKKSDKLHPGFISGLFFILVFSARFVLEFFKAPQEAIIDQSFLQIGQYLSIPLILFGMVLLYKSRNIPNPIKTPK